MPGGYVKPYQMPPHTAPPRPSPDSGVWLKSLDLIAFAIHGSIRSGAGRLAHLSRPRAPGPP
jgi:hypothetical protein